IMGCSNDKKDISNNFNINKMNKKTFDEVIKKFNAEHTLMLNVIFNCLLKISLNLYKKHI
ncbi:hypothetical protein, partial [Clostridium tarantellae]|uniref:hypothetical protein n=1 Tax=Clostridium tarantellae TaxID=39493 RepID=UPI001A9B0690